MIKTGRNRPVRPSTVKIQIGFDPALVAKQHSRNAAVKPAFDASHCAGLRLDSQAWQQLGQALMVTIGIKSQGIFETAKRQRGIRLRMDEWSWKLLWLAMNGNWIGWKLRFI